MNEPRELTVHQLMQLLENARIPLIKCPVGMGNQLRQWVAEAGIGPVNIEEDRACPPGKVLFIPPSVEDMTP